MEILKVIALGITEGVTEFLPVSSTGHLIILNKFINFTGDFANTFDVVIQLGAILSVIVYFWNKLVPIGDKSEHEKHEILDIWKKTIFAVIPALLIGGTIGKKVEEYLFNPIVVSIALIIGGIIIILIERKNRRSRIKSIKKVSYKRAFLIGLLQCLAMIPGTSRSGATIIGAMFLGLSRKTAAEFSFFLAIPTLAAASAYSLLKHGLTLTGSEWVMIAIGFAVSFFVAWGVIALFMSYIQKKDFKVFGYYRIVLGIIVICFMAFMK